MDMTSNHLHTKSGIAQFAVIIPEESSGYSFLYRRQMSVNRRKVLSLLGVLFLSLLWSCTPQKVIENARTRGANAGHNDGLNAGKAEGYEAAYAIAEKTAYTATLNHLYSTGQYNRTKTYTLVVVIGAFLIGFSLQYFLLYLLRKAEFLYDIDRVVLRKRATAVDLSNLSDSLKNFPTAPERPKLSSSKSDT